MIYVRDPYWKLNPDIVADETAAERYSDYDYEEEEEDGYPV